MSKVTDEMVRVFSSAVSGGSIKDGFQALFDAKLISLPVDEAAIRESVVREAAEKLRHLISYVGAKGEWEGGVLDAIHELEKSFLPTKDRAEELAKKFLATDKWGDSPSLTEDLADAFRWLIEREGGNG